jgi:hypothetical protein
VNAITEQRATNAAFWYGRNPLRRLRGATDGRDMTMDEPEGLVRARLKRIAQALDLPPDHFFTEAATHGVVAEANECLRLWGRIRTPEDRRRALEALRALAEAEGA